MIVKELLDLYDNWNQVIKINKVEDDEWKVVEKAVISNFSGSPLENAEVEAFGFYEGELCVRIKEEMVNIKAYKDCTGFFTQEECNEDNLTDIIISKDVFERWLAVKGWSCEDFMETYTADDTMGLVYWLMDSGLRFTVKGAKCYSYGMLHRPFSIGCQPREGFVYRQESRNEKYFDIIWYRRPLTETEINDFELEELEVA